MDDSTVSPYAGKTSTNVDAKLLAGISWLFFIGAIITLFVEKENEEVKTQAWQAILFKIVGYLLGGVFAVMIIFFLPLGMAYGSGDSLLALMVILCGSGLAFVASLVVSVFPWVAAILVLVDKKIRIPGLYRLSESLAGVKK